MSSNDERRYRAWKRVLRNEEEARKRAAANEGPITIGGDDSEPSSGRTPSCVGALCTFVVMIGIFGIIKIIPTKEETRDVRVLSPEGPVDNSWMSQNTLEASIARYLQSRARYPEKYRRNVDLAIEDASKKSAVIIKESDLPRKMKLAWFEEIDGEPALLLYRIDDARQSAKSDLYKKKLADLVNAIDAVHHPGLKGVTQMWNTVFSSQATHVPETLIASMGQSEATETTEPPQNVDPERALRTAKVIKADYAIMFVYHKLDRETQRAYEKMLPRSVLDHEVLQCKFNHPSGSVTERFYWYKTLPADLKKLKDTLPADHHIWEIRQPFTDPPTHYDSAVDKTHYVRPTL